MLTEPAGPRGDGSAGRVAIPNPDEEECAAMVAAEPALLAVPLTSHALLGALAAGCVPSGAVGPRGQLVGRGWAGRFPLVWLDYCGTFASAAGLPLPALAAAAPPPTSDPGTCFTRAQAGSGSWTSGYFSSSSSLAPAGIGQGCWRGSPLRPACHFADAASPSRLMHLLKVEGGAAE